jgi:uracil-DNA glycosylase
MQGVLLLNSALTVEDGQAASHAKCGWEALTQALVGAVASDLRPKAFLLWGAHAQAQREQIAAASPEHLVLQSNHPSPLSALRPPLPFIGNGHFSAVNRFLSDHGQPPVDWSAPGVVGGPKR